MSSNSQAPSPLLARALVRSLTRGTAIAEGARYIHVGHERWLAAQSELLEEVAEDGHSETKFIRGAYGSGKSHFLAVVQDRARDAGWATSHVECKADGVQIDRFETLYPRVFDKLLTADLIETRCAATAPDVDAARFVLDKWAREQLKRAGVKEGGLTRPLDADHRIYGLLAQGLQSSSLLPAFTTGLLAYARAYNAQDATTLISVARWLRGGTESIAIPEHYNLHPTNTGRPGRTITIRPIGRATAHDAMRCLLWLVRSAGYRGLVLCIDEVEELAKLREQRRRDQALQALREYVDHAGGEGGYRHLCMYLAATPEMFEGEHYFPRYDALATRIQPVGKEINWRAPVVDLERTPLRANELKEMARRIAGVHRLGYPGSSDAAATEAIDRLVEGVVAGRLQVAKPRLLARAVVDELERARQQGADYQPRSVTEVIDQTALALNLEATGS